MRGFSRSDLRKYRMVPWFSVFRSFILSFVLPLVPFGSIWFLFLSCFFPFILTFFLCPFFLRIVLLVLYSLSSFLSSCALFFLFFVFVCQPWHILAFQGLQMNGGQQGARAVVKECWIWGLGKNLTRSTIQNHPDKPTISKGLPLGILRKV